MTIYTKGSPLHQRKKSNKSKNDNWWTPIWLFSVLCKIYDFHPDLDVACDSRNCVCEQGINKKQNALKCDWLFNRNAKNVEICEVWCNPPNGKLGEFIRKAYEQYTHYGMRIMMIVPTNTMSSNAFWDCIENPKDKGEKVFYKPIYKRIQFLDKGKKPESSARNAYLVVIWG